MTNDNEITAAFQVDLGQLDDDGLVYVGGRCTAAWMLAAYRRGIFPWPSFAGMDASGKPCFHNAWFSPDPRWGMTIQSLHVPRRLGRRIRRNEFTYSVSRRFGECVERCGRREGWEQAWLSPELEQGYFELQALGHALSFEVWQAEQLVGGIIGVQVGGYFSAESMFHSVRDASKVGLVMLVRRLSEAGFLYVDVQQPSPHVCQLGAFSLSRQNFLDRHHAAISVKRVASLH